MFNYKIFEKIVENHSNGFIILNKDKMVIYGNNKIKRKFSSAFNNLLGDYLKCTFTLNEKIHCQETTNCTSCIINNCLDMAFNTKKVQNLFNLQVNLNHSLITLSMEIQYVDSFYILEFFNLEKSKEELDYLIKILDKSEDLMFFKDSTLKYKYINKSFSDLLNLTKDEIYGKKDTDLFPEELVHQCLRGDLITLEKGHYSEIEKFNDNFYRVLKENINGGILGVAKNITTEIKEKTKAEVDVLTSLYNRRKYIEVIDEIYTKKIQTYYLILIDLDNLRSINNNYGHAIGDFYLKKTGEILNNYTEGIFFRIGGDEFAGLINRDSKKIKVLIDDIFKDINNLNLNPKLSISAGIKLLDINKPYLENYTDVDSILYSVKKYHKGSYTIK